jgi:hypothetical protein
MRLASQLRGGGLALTRSVTWDSGVPLERFARTHENSRVSLPQAGQPAACQWPGRHLWLAEREHVRLGAGLEERDLKRPLADRVVLADELI